MVLNPTGRTHTGLPYFPIGWFWASIVSTTTVDLLQAEQLFLSNRTSYSLARTFGNLKVRPKLMVLHNLFFLVLACAAYFSLIPLFEKQVADAREAADRQATAPDREAAPAGWQATAALVRGRLEHVGIGDDRRLRRVNGHDRSHHGGYRAL